MKKISALSALILATLLTPTLVASAGNGDLRTSSLSTKWLKVEFSIDGEGLILSDNANLLNFTTMSGEGEAVEVLSTVREDGTTITATIMRALPQDASYAPDEESDEILISRKITAEGTSEISEVKARDVPVRDLSPVLAWAEIDGGLLVTVPEGSSIQSTSAFGAEKSKRLSDSSQVLSTIEGADSAKISVEKGGDIYEYTIPLQLAPSVKSSASLVPAAASKAALASVLPVELRYATFIPNSKVPLPKIGPISPCDVVPTHANDSYGGDSRSWRSATNLGLTPDRTRMYFKYNWTTKKFSQEKWVSTTRQYMPNGSLRRFATASSSGLTFTHHVGSESYMRIRLNHSSKNPLCSVAGPIAYYAIVDIYSNGSFSIVGSRVAVPNHEILGRFTSVNKYQVIERTPGVSFHCLTVSVGCPASQSLNKSGTMPR